MFDSQTCTPAPTHQRTKVYFGLLPGFSLLSLSGAIEALSFANEYAGHPLFEWVACSENGLAVADRTGQPYQINSVFPQLCDRDYLFVCSGENVVDTCTDQVLAWVRRSARFGANLGGFDTGSAILAKAHVLNGAATTIHWRNRAAFSEAYPEEQLTGQVYTVDRGRFSTAGGTSSIDLMLHIITDHCGEEIAHRVSARMNYTKIRVLQNSEQVQTADRTGFRHPKLSAILSLMETNLEEPLRPHDLAQSVNISARQMERLFRRYLGATPSAYYTVMRLEHARNLLLQSDMYMTDVAIACGFGSSSHFSKRFRGHFGYSPYQLRNR